MYAIIDMTVLSGIAIARIRLKLIYTSQRNRIAKFLTPMSRIDVSAFNKKGNIFTGEVAISRRIKLVVTEAANVFQKMLNI